MNFIKASAPGKLMLLGEHSVVYGHPCMVTAIEIRIQLSITKNEENTIFFNTPGTTDHTFLKAIIAYAKNTWNISSGLTIDVLSPFSGKYGFGSSSAITVATVKALTELFSVSLTPQELFNHCYKIVLAVQKIGSGFDIASAIYGGTIYYEQFGKHIESLPHKPYSLVIGYSGQKANTVSIVEEVKKKKEAYPEKVDRIFKAISDLVIKAKKSLQEGDWETYGKYMNFNQEYLRDLGVSTESLENLISAANAAGAYGAKLSGAGGGDSMIALCSPDTIQPVQIAIKDAGGEVVTAEPDAHGVILIQDP